MKCSLHNVPSVWKEGVSKKTGKPYAFWGCDVKTNGGYCTAEQIGDPTPPKETREPVDQSVNKWIPVKKNENQSMIRMSALKAASEVVSAYIARPDSELPKNITELLLQVSDRTLLWLKGNDLTSSTVQTTEEEKHASSEEKVEEDLF